MSRLSFTLHTTFLDWNKVTLMCYSRDRNAYSRAKRRESALAVNEIKKQVELKNYFPSGSVRISYVWHTTHKYDLGNLIAGEKVIDDVINETGLWSDDAQVTHIDHQRIADTKDFIEVTIESGNDPENIGFKRGQRTSIKYSVYFHGKSIGTYTSIRGVCTAIHARPSEVQNVLDGKYRTVRGCEVKIHD